MPTKKKGGGRKKKSTVRIRGSAARSRKDAINSSSGRPIVYGDFQEPPPTEYEPTHGWIEELLVAKKSAERDSESFGKRWRVCRAARVLRNWDELKAQVELAENILDRNGFAASCNVEEMDDAPSNMEQVVEYKEFVDKVLHQRSREFAATGIVPSFEMSSQFETPVSTGRNLNFMQDCAQVGNIFTMECAVAFGAPIDYGIHDDDRDERAVGRNGPSPLHLATMFLANVPSVANHPSFREHKAKFVRSVTECAVVLVMLGADLTTPLPEPLPETPLPGTPLPRTPLPELRRFHSSVRGKNAKELAERCGQVELLRAIAVMEQPDAHKIHAWCRCGSRLPARICHSCPAVAGGQQAAHWILNELHSRNEYRLSPLAPCPCERPNWNYFDCCWLLGAPVYLSDSDGKRLCFSYSDVAFHVHGLAPEESLWPKAMDAIFEELKEVGLPAFFTRRRVVLREESRVHKWDADVYIRIISSLCGGFFMWWDFPWLLGAQERVVRVKPWNTALVKYLDTERKELSDNEREAIRTLYSATPFAHCVTCGKVETSIAAYEVCNRCKGVAYCSHRCQRIHWKMGHVSRCSLLPVEEQKRRFESAGNVLTQHGSLGAAGR